MGKCPSPLPTYFQEKQANKQDKQKQAESFPVLLKRGNSYGGTNAETSAMNWSLASRFKGTKQLSQ
jgi:hypothetical protein